MLTLMLEMEDEQDNVVKGLYWFQDNIHETSVDTSLSILPSTELNK